MVYIIKIGQHFYKLRYYGLRLCVSAWSTNWLCHAIASEMTVNFSFLLEHQVDLRSSNCLEILKQSSALQRHSVAPTPSIQCQLYLSGCLEALIIFASYRYDDLHYKRRVHRSKSLAQEPMHDSVPYKIQLYFYHKIQLQWHIKR